MSNVHWEVGIFAAADAFQKVVVLTIRIGVKFDFFWTNH